MQRQQMGFIMLVVALPSILALEHPSVFAAETKGPLGWTREEHFQKKAVAEFQRDFAAANFGRIARWIGLYGETRPDYKGVFAIAPLIDAGNAIDRMHGRTPPFRASLPDRLWRSVNSLLDEFEPSGSSWLGFAGKVSRVLRETLPPFYSDADRRASEYDALKVVPALTRIQGATIEWDLRLLATANGRNQLEHIYSEVLRAGADNKLHGYAVKMLFGVDPEHISDLATQRELQELADVAPDEASRATADILVRRDLKKLRQVREKYLLRSRQGTAGAAGDANLAREDSSLGVSDEEPPMLSPGRPQSLARQLDRDPDIRDAQLIHGLTVSILKGLGGEGPKVAAALDIIGTATFNVIAASASPLAPVAVPLAILNGVVELGNLIIGMPDRMHILLQEVLELRKELREFRHEYQVSNALLHHDLLLKADALALRIDTATRSLMQELGEVRAELKAMQQNELELTNRLAGYHQQLLGRLENIHRLVAFDKDYETYKGIRDVALTGLRPGGKGEIEYYSLLSRFGAFSFKWAAASANAGGDFRTFDAYNRSLIPTLSIQDACSWIDLADTPRGAWSSINDYANLAASAGIALPAAAGLIEAPRLAGGEQLINPDCWALGALGVLDLTERSPELFKRPEGRDDRHQRLAKIYFQGERLRAFLDSVTRDPQYGTARREVFDRLLAVEEEAIGYLEETLVNQGLSLTKTGLDFWAQDPLKVDNDKLDAPDAIRVEVPRPEDKSKVDIRLSPDQRGFELPGPLDFAKDEKQRKLEQRQLLETVPQAYRLAAQLKWPGHNAPDKLEFCYDEVRLENVRRVVRRDFDGMPKWLPSQSYLNTNDFRIRGYVPHDGTEIRDGWVCAYKNVNEYRGNVVLVVRADFIQAGVENTRRTIYRKRLTTPKEELVGVERTREFDQNNSRHLDIEGFHTEGRCVRKYTDSGFLGLGRKITYAVVVDEPADFRKRQVELHWPISLKPQLLGAAPDEDTANEQVMRGRADAQRELETAITNLAQDSVLKLNAGADYDAKMGVGDVGRALRMLYGAQMATRRFVELAMPEELAGDAQLAALVSGDRAVLHWSTLSLLSLSSATAASEPNKAGAFKVDLPKGALSAGPNGRPTVHAAQEMRLRLGHLRTALNEGVASRVASQRPPHHEAIDSVLEQIVVRAKALGVDLEAELERLGAKPNDEWILRARARDIAELNRLMSDWRSSLPPCPALSELETGVAK